MSRLRSWIDSPLWPKLAALAAVIFFMSTAVGWVLKALNLAQKVPLTIITSNVQELFNLAVFFAILFLGLGYWRITRRVAVSFRDRFKGELNENWEFEGAWSKPESGTLCVTNSEAGGLTKAGSLWENYTFEFETKIINKCSQWIIRAQDLNNYFLFQCKSDMIYPALRRAVPTFESDPNAPPEQKRSVPILNVQWAFGPGVPHHLELKDWFRVKIEVRGSTAKVWINGALVYSWDNIVPYQRGRVGFRNHGDESAYFRNVRVRPIP